MTKVIGMIAVKNEKGNYLIQIGQGGQEECTNIYNNIISTDTCITIPVENYRIEQIFRNFADDIISKIRM